MQKYLLLWSLSLFISIPAAAQAPLEANIVALRIPLHLELDKSGLLVEMHQWLMDRAKVHADLTVMPGVRARAMFEAEKADGLYPSWISATYNADVLYSAPLMQVDHFIYTKPGAAAFSTLADLKGRRLGLVQHYELELDFAAQENLTISYARNSQTLITLLLSGRVDAIILSDIEATALQRALQLEPLSVDSSAVIAKKYMGYVFLNNPAGIALHERINNAIADAKRSGALQAYVEKAVGDFK